MIRNIIFLFLLSPFLLFAQNTASLHCTFVSATTDSVTVIPSQYFIDEYEKSYASVIKNNQCDFSLPVTKPAIVKFLFNNQPLILFLEPGDQLKIKIGKDSLYKSVSYSGKGDVQNQFLTSFYQTFNYDFDKEMIAAEILSTDADAFEMKLFEERKKQMAFYNSYASKGSFSESFKKYVENTIRYNYFARLLSFPIIRANQSPQILTVKAFPAVMLKGIDSTLVNDEALNAESYRDFLYYFTVYFTSEANGFNKFKDLNLSLEYKVRTAVRNFSGQSLTWCIASLLNKEVEKVSQYTAKHIYDVLSLKENNGTYTALLKRKVDTRLAAKDVVASDQKNNEKSTSSGITYPKLKDIDGNYFTFDDLKGKVVYVDYWASWCGPCRMQMPYSKQLKAMFDEKQLKQIVFLYVSIDGTEEAWKNSVKQLGIEGINAISPGNWQSPVAKFFGITSIPRYMLIDKKGNIADLNANRPGMAQEIYNDILKLLE